MEEKRLSEDSITTTSEGEGETAIIGGILEEEVAIASEVVVKLSEGEEVSEEKATAKVVARGSVVAMGSEGEGKTIS